MELLEYQAKDLFAQVDIPILPSQPIEDVAALKRLQIPYPVVLKSQVRAGGRGRAGGVRFVENTIDAIAAAQAIFGLPIQGEYPEVVLAEARYASQEEFFLAVLIDYELQRPVLLGSAKGGMDVETLLENLEKVVVEEFSPFYARRLAVKMGIKGCLLQSVSLIIEKMYHLLMDKDLDLIEINPLGVSASGEVMALDGKITVNNAALARHPDLQTFAPSPASPKTDLPLPAFLLANLPGIPTPQSLPQVDPQGAIAIIASSPGVALTTWDALVQGKGQIAQGLILASGYPPEGFAQQLLLALHQLLVKPGLQAILVNVIESAEVITAVVNALSDYLQPQLRHNKDDRQLRVTGSVFASRDRSEPLPLRQQLGHDLPSIILRLVSPEEQGLGEGLSSLPVFYTSKLEQAVKQTLTLALQN
jgi:succinyl-CoA synthetase beta subunit